MRTINTDVSCRVRSTSHRYATSAAVAAIAAAGLLTSEMIFP